MNLQSCPLWSGGVPDFRPEWGQAAPSLTAFPVPGTESAVLILPGGGYEYKADHEGAPIAERLNRLGISAAVLDYRVSPYRAPVPQGDALRAVEVLRGQGCRRVALLGFSAGAHVAASAAYLGPEGPSRPDAAVLCYPVITMGAFTHAGSRDHLLGPDAPDSLRDQWSVEKHIPENAPPAFIWHTADDGAVPVQNSLALAQALAERHIPCELHIWPHGHHGLGLAEDLPDIGRWPVLAAEWLRRQGF